MQMDLLIIIHIEQVQIMSASPAVVVHQDGKNQLEVLSKAPESCGDASLIELDKEPSRLGDDITTKVRKPYTITKQRERWTDEEHQKFLEALKLYGRAWRQIEEHVGTKTAVQIRSHAQKFFSKLAREGSSGSLKAPVSDIDIPPPRPKRKPAHPYPRKGIAFSSQNVSLSSQVSGRTESSGCELSLPCDTAVAIRRTNELPTSEILEATSPCPLNCSTKKASPVSFCQKPRKRGTEEVQCDAFPNEVQEMPKLSRSTCSEPELTSSPIGILVPQAADTLMLHNNNMPFGVYGSKFLTTFQQMALPYHYPMPPMAALQNAAPLLNSATANPSQLGKLDDMPAFTNLLAAHAHLSSTIMPWINHNPVALAAAAAAVVTTSWPGLGLQPPPLPLPLRPPSILSDSLNIESSSTVAAGMAAAAAASFADASAWLALHGTFAHPPNVPEGRSLYKPNPVVHSALVEGHQQQVLTDSSGGSKNGDNGCDQTSSEEHEASTLDGMPETIAQVNHPNPMAGDHDILSAGNQQSNSHQCEKETLKTQENPGHNSSTDSSSNEKKGKKRNGSNCTSGNFLLVESKNGLQDSAYLIVHGKKLGKKSIEVNSSEMDLSPSMYQGSNSPKSNISPKISKEDEEDCGYNGKIHDSLDALTSSVLVADGTLKEQKDFMAPQCITNTSQMAIEVEIGVSLQRENRSSHTRHEDMPGEVSIAADQQQCVSSCGSTDNKKGEAHASPVISSKSKDIAMKESEPKHHTEDCGSEITPYEKARKVLVQACLKRWQGGEIMFTHACTNSKSIVSTVRGNSTCRAEAKENDSQQEEARSSLAMGLINGSKQSLPLVQTQSLHDSKASSSGSSKYKGHGFVPYRRS